MRAESSSWQVLGRSRGSFLPVGTEAGQADSPRPPQPFSRAGPEKPQVGGPKPLQVGRTDVGPTLLEPGWLAWSAGRGRGCPPGPCTSLRGASPFRFQRPQGYF